MIVLIWLAAQVAIIGYVSWMQPTTAVAAGLVLALAVKSFPAQHVVFSRVSAADRLTAAIAALMLMQSLFGLVFHSQYRDVEWIKATWLGNDWVTLVIGVPSRGPPVHET